MAPKKKFEDLSPEAQKFGRAIAGALSKKNRANLNVYDDINKYTAAIDRGEPAHFKSKDPAIEQAALKAAMRTSSPARANKIAQVVQSKKGVWGKVKDVASLAKQAAESQYGLLEKAKGAASSVATGAQDVLTGARDVLIGAPAKTEALPTLLPEQEAFVRQMAAQAPELFQQSIEEMRALKQSPLESQMSQLYQMISPQLAQQAMNQQIPQVLYPSQIAQMAQQPGIANVLAQGLGNIAQDPRTMQYLLSDQVGGDLSNLFGKLGSGVQSGYGAMQSLGGYASPLMERLAGLFRRQEQ